MNNRWLLVVYLTAIFIAGSISGWVVAAKTNTEKSRPQFRDPGRIHEDIRQKTKTTLHSELPLTTEQGQKLDSIVDQSFDEMKPLRDKHMREIMELMSNRNDRIMAVLNPEQQKTFLENERRRWEKFRHGPPRGHGPPGSSSSRGKDGKCETNGSNLSPSQKGKS